MLFLKQSTAYTAKIGPFLDSTDGNTQEVGLTIAQADVMLSKNGGAFAAKNDATSCTHDAKGMYGCPLNTTDTGTLGKLQLLVHVAGALAVWHDFMVLPANVYDSLIGGTDYLDAAVVEQANIDFGALQKASLNAATPASIQGDTKQTGDAYAEAVLVHAHAAGAETQATAAATDAAAAHVQADHIHDTDLPAVKTDTAAILVDTGTTLDAALTVVDGNIDSILADTGTDGVVVAAASKTGYALSTAGIQAIWDVLTSAFTTVGSIGKKLADWIVGTIDTYTGNTKQTGDNYTRIGAPAGASVSADIGAVKEQTAAIEADTQDLQTKVGVAGAGLTALGDARIANLDAAISSRSTYAGGAVASVAGNVGGNVTGSIGSLAAQAKADVNAEVADVVKVDTIAEMTQGVPPVAPTILEILNHLYRRLRNKVTDDGSNIKVYNGAKDTVLFKAPVSDDGSTFTKDEYVSGA